MSQAYTVVPPVHSPQQRSFAVSELLAAESNYVEQLAYCLSQVLQPLVQQQQLPPATSQLLYQQLEGLHSFGVAFLPNISARAVNWDDRGMMGDVFTSGAKFFYELYSSFVCHYDQLHGLVQQTMKCCPDASAFVMETKKNSGKDLFDFVQLPLAQLTQYALFLERMVSATDNAHYDYQYCLAALNMVHQIINAVDQFCSPILRTRERLSLVIARLRSNSGDLEMQDYLAKLIPLRMALTKYLADFPEVPSNTPNYDATVLVRLLSSLSQFESHIVRSSHFNQVGLLPPNHRELMASLMSSILLDFNAVFRNILQIPMGPRGSLPPKPVAQSSYTPSQAPGTPQARPPSGIAQPSPRPTSSIAFNNPSLRQTAPSSPPLPRAASTSTAFSRLIDDEEGQLMWAESFGQSKFQVPRAEFMVALRSYLGVPINENEEKMLMFVLDNNNSGYISLHNFSQFLLSFGPIASCTHNMQLTFSSPWFCGFLSHSEAVRLLDNELVGTYLVRFSQSKPGSFALEVVILDNGKPSVLPIQIKSTANGFGIHESDTGEREFPTLQELIAFYTAYLVHPLVNPLVYEHWFHGDLSSTETSELLSNQVDGTFLIRFSSRPGCFASSFVESGVVKHALIQQTPKGYCVDGDVGVYDTIPALVQSFTFGLQHAYKCERMAQMVSRLANEEMQRQVAARENPQLRPAVSLTTEGIVFMPDKVSVKGGLVPALVAQLFTSQNSAKYTSTFLLTYRSFATPDELMENLRLKFLAHSNTGLEDKKTRLRICNFTKQWCQKYPQDFLCDPELTRAYRDFVENEIRNSESEVLSQQLLKTLDKAHERIEQDLSADGGGGVSLIFTKDRPKPIVPKPLRRTVSVAFGVPLSPSLTAAGSALSLFTLADLDPLEIARQLTLIEEKIFKAIQPKELLGLGWSKKDKETRSPNILLLISRFNAVSNWVSRSIVKEDDIRKRVAVFEKWIRVSKCCRDVNNFNGAMEVIAGLENSAVFRLKKTKAKISPKLLQDYDECHALMSRDRNSAALRDVIHNSNPPLIPYFGMYLSDLTFIEEGNPDMLDGGLVNFHKRTLIAQVINDEIAQYQQTPYNLEPVPEIREWCMASSAKEDEGMISLFDQSLTIEPREPKK